MSFPTTWRRPPQIVKSRFWRIALTLGAVVYLALALNTVEVNWTRVAEGIERGQRFVAGFLAPDFSTRWRDISLGLVESLTMTLTATVAGVLISVPIGIGAARNVAPVWVHAICRSVIAVSRSLQEIIVAILFVAMFGFGAFAGFLTLTFATIGFIGKLLADDIEEIDPRQVEAVRATGASWGQTINYAVQPQVMPRLIGLSLYRLDINFRESAVIGIVGAGGIGGTLDTSLSRYEYGSAGAILIIIIAIVMLSEYASSRMRGVAEMTEWRHRSSKTLWAFWFVTVALFGWCWQIMTERTMWVFVQDAPRAAADIANRAFPPRWSYMEQLWQPLWDTLNIATLGTLLGVIIAVPLAWLAASNTTPSRLVLRPLALLCIVASRSINSLIWALLLVSILGPGLLAGIIAIAFRSVGFVGKLLYEAIEETDVKQVEAITATGASSAQVLHYAIVPQVLPSFLGISVFRWDINIRESAILGLVGAGGIGMQLQASLNVLAWPQVLMICIVILGTVIVSEWVSGKVRRAII